MTLNIELLDEIFNQYTLDKLAALRRHLDDPMWDANGPPTIFCALDDEEERVCDVVCVPVENDEQLPEALIKICLQLGPPDWVAVMSDTYTMQNVVGEEHPGELAPLFEAGDPRVHEELLMLAIHKNDDGIMVTRRYENKPDYVDMHGIVWTGWPRNARMGYIANVLQMFVDRYEFLDEQHVKLHFMDN